MQEKVACLDDNEAHLALDPRNKYRIQVDSSMLENFPRFLYSIDVSIFLAESASIYLIFTLASALSDKTSWPW